MLQTRPKRGASVRGAWIATIVSLTLLSGCGMQCIISVGQPCLIDKVRLDPVFKTLNTPLLFAHRGGAAEAPQSTLRAFRYALEQTGTDVLELDVRMTCDRQMVVWHGPELDIVRIVGQPDIPRFRSRRDIGQYTWDEIRDRGWVADPWEVARYHGDDNDLSSVPMEPDRRLLLLSEFLDAFRCAPLNIEIKDRISPTEVDSFVALLRDAPPCADAGARKRTILVASAIDAVLRRLEKISVGEWPTSVPLLLHFAQIFRVPLPGMLGNRSLETLPCPITAGRSVIKQMHASGGAVHPFISRFLGISGLDEDPCVEDEKIKDLLDRGVDGIMTDRPCAVRAVIDEWLGIERREPLACEAELRRHDQWCERRTR